MQLKMIYQFGLDRIKEYKNTQEKTDDLLNFILGHVMDLRPGWIIMSPQLISILLTSPKCAVTAVPDTPGEYILHPTETRITSNMTAGSNDEMHAILFSGYTDSMHILNCGRFDAFTGGMRLDDEWNGTMLFRELTEQRLDDARNRVTKSVATNGALPPEDAYMPTVDIRHVPDDNGDNRIHITIHESRVHEDIVVVEPYVERIIQPPNENL